MVYSRIIVEAKHTFGANADIISKARVLRKKMTPPEKLLWDCLRKRQLNGMHFRKQHPYGIYILDFYCCSANLAIEIDGLIHLKRKAYDKERTEFLESSGLSVLRFTNKDIEDRIDWVIKEIKLRLG
jgi:very-short-patch-repair endonuclease